ncbi:MAG: Hsp20/alpha crystallin family protein [Desulfobacteraceae bacterium]|nr:Hsp20/alpha crystallin family protein [Desulfobacteraceae bacterium]MCB9494251.1 Hsp20/alpha crystallin family protein [Desulfobacteraceae bacterium]
MAIVRWEPFRNVASLQDRINRMFDDVFSRMDSSDMDEAAVGAWKPASDIYETADAIIVEIELAGVKKEDVNVEVNDNVLSIKGERKIEKEENSDNYYRRERFTGKFHRAFTIPMDVDVEKISAKFKDGVLVLEIPKPEEKKPKKINVALEE